MADDARKVYGDIIDREHYVDPNHPQMSRLNRAAQFSPFAALTGYEDLIDESARLTDGRVELDESKKDEIARRINVLLQMENAPVAGIRYFVQDSKKSGGSYETVTGKVKKYDALARAVILNSDVVVFIDDITDVKADCFED